MRQLVLPLVFGVAFTLINSNLLALDFSGNLNVLFDNETLFETNGSSKVRSAITLELPLLPGEHTLTVNNQSVIYHLFDVMCSGDGEVYCEVDAKTTLTLPVNLICGDYQLKTQIIAPENITTTLSLWGICTTAQVEIGDWVEVLNVTPQFTNQIMNMGPGIVEVYLEGELVLNKTVNEHVSFPELNPGNYTIDIIPDNTVSKKNVSGKLIIEDTSLSDYKYSVVLSILLISSALFFKG